MRFVLVSLLGLVALALLAAPASAALRVCNQTSYILYAAGGYQAGPTVYTHGWTRIVPGDCSDVFPGPLKASGYYLYARSSQAHSGPARAWGGVMRLCAKDTNFTLQYSFSVPGCTADDSFQLPFAAVATHGKSDWTTTLTESSLLTSLDLARQVGIARLLNDIGYKIGKGNSDDAKARSDALTAFRARMKLPVTATNADLFAALESEALKASAPAGYSVCNDSGGEIWAALGIRNGTGWVSRGWWKIAPGACAKTLTDPLATDKVYLLAQTHNNDHLVSGPDKFCVTNIEFEVFGRDKCASQGLSEAGFAATDTKGRIGYAAHIGKDGLVAPANQTAQMHASK